MQRFGGDDGSIQWHFQTAPHDGLGFDGVNEPVSFDYQEGGKIIKAAATAERNGFFYMLDRNDGKFIRGFPFVDKITWAKGLLLVSTATRPSWRRATPGCLRRRSSSGSWSRMMR